MRDRYGKELTMTVTFERNNDPQKVQMTLSDESDITQMIDAIYAGLIFMGYSEAAVMSGIHEYMAEKMKYASCFDEYNDSYTYKEAYERGCDDERYNLRKYASEHKKGGESVDGKTPKLVDVDEYIQDTTNNDNED